MVWNYRRRLWLLVLLTAVPLVAAAQADPEVEPEAESTLRLQPITVLGTRTAKTPDEIPRSIDVVGRAQIEQEQAANLGQIVAPLPNVSLTNGPRPVAQQIRIRGLTGQHVLLLVDGVRQDFDVGHMGTGFISPGLIESVAIERGPGGVMWGSGALGGVISVNTKEAEDLLADDQDFGALVFGGYQSATDGWATRGAVYGHLGDNLDALLQFGRRSNEDLELGNDTALAYSAYRRNSLLAKATWHVAQGNSLQFSHRRLHLQGVSPGAPAGTGSALEDRATTVAASRVEWQLVPPQSELVDLTFGLSHIRTEVDENGVGVSQHDETVIAGLGVDVANTSRFNLGAAGRHVLTYGFDVNRKTVEATRDGRPRLSTPAGSLLLAGVFLQDEIHWNEAWTTVLGIRYDHFSSESDTAVAPDKNDSELSIQAGLLWQATAWLQLYASYAEAFRAPAISEMYVGGRHDFGGGAYATFQPNPGLKPETAANKEIGIRMDWQDVLTPADELKFELSAFRNDVEDYIEGYMEMTIPPGPPPPFAPAFEIGYRNASEVQLEGFEAQASYTTEAWFVSVSYGQTRGHNETADQPLASVPADTWVVRAGLTALPWNGRVTWRMTHAEPQDRVAPGGLTTDSYTVHDLLTTWQPTDKLRLDFGIGNITDRDYRVHNSVIKAAGRNVKLGVTWQF